MEAPGSLDALAVRAKTDPAVRARLVEQLWPLLSRLVRRYAGGGVSVEDLRQEAVVGLLRAVERYDASRGPFGAWLRVWVRQALQLAVAEQSRAVSLPTHVLWDLHELKEARERFGRRRLREPRLVELADELGWSVMRIEEVLRIEEPGERLEAEHVEHQAARDAFEDVLLRVTARQVAPLLARLTEREREVLEARSVGQSLRQVGRRLGVSQERVRQVEERALVRVRRAARIAP